MKLFKISENYLFKNGSEILREIIISIIFASLVGATVSYFFDYKLDRRVAHREFIYNFNRTFFDNQKYRNISTAIEEQYLYNRGNILKVNGGNFTDYEIDDYLGLFYDIWNYGEDRFVSESLIDRQFAYYVCITYQNKEIKEYRNRLEKEGFSKESAFDFLDDFAEDLRINNETNCKDGI